MDQIERDQMLTHEIAKQAFVNAIKITGLANFKKCSLFMSNAVLENHQEAA